MYIPDPVAYIAYTRKYAQRTITWRPRILEDTAYTCKLTRVRGVAASEPPSAAVCTLACRDIKKIIDSNCNRNSRKS